MFVVSCLLTFNSRWETMLADPGKPELERFANGRHTHNDPQTNQNNPNRSLGLRRRQRLASRSPWCVPPLAADTFLPSRTFPQSVSHLDYRVATVPPVPPPTSLPR